MGLFPTYVSSFPFVLPDARLSQAAAAAAPEERARARAVIGPGLITGKGAHPHSVPGTPNTAVSLSLSLSLSIYLSPTPRSALRSARVACSVRRPPVRTCASMVNPRPCQWLASVFGEGSLSANSVNSASVVAPINLAYGAVASVVASSALLASRDVCAATRRPSERA